MTLPRRTLEETTPAGAREAFAWLRAETRGGPGILEVATPLDFTDEKLVALLSPFAAGASLEVAEVSLAFVHQGPAPWPRSSPATLRRLAPADVTPLVARFDASFEQSAPVGRAPGELSRLLHEAARSDRGRVAELRGATVGLVAFGTEGRVGFVSWVGVEAASRGQGIGEALQADAVAALFTSGVREVRGGASPGNGPMVRIFEALGYREERLLYELLVKERRAP